MRKTLKALTAAVLAFIIAFSYFSAFAAEEKNVLLWNEWEYSYAGTLSEGDNSFEIPAEDGFYFVFNAEKAGYYTVSNYWSDIDYFRSPETVENGVGEGFRISEFLDTNEESDVETYLFFFDEGENYLASWCGYPEYEGDKADVEITYYGETVTDISFVSGTEYFLIYDWNLVELYDEEEKYPENSYYFDGDKTVLTFDSGKTISLIHCDLICTFKDKLEIGESNVTVYYMNNSFEKTISVYPVSKEITKAEITDIEKYLDVPIAYNSNLLYDFDGMEITFTYANGNTKTVTVYGGEWAEIELQNGYPYSLPIDYFYDREGDKVYLCISVGGEQLLRKEGTLREATKKENRQHLYYRIYEILSDAIYDIEFSFESVRWAENLWEGIVYLRRAIFKSADEIFTAFEEIVEEIAGCLRG